MYSGGGRSRDSNSVPFWAVGLVVLLAGWIGVFFGRLIKAAVSRQREYLADASAVQFTRQTSGLTGALKKIGGLEAGSRLLNPKTENVSHMLFGEGMNFSALYATHPPLVKRIQVLEPDFTTGNLDQLRQGWLNRPPDGLAEDSRVGFADAQVQEAPRRQLSAREYTAAVGNPTAASYRAEGVSANEIPQQLTDLAHNSATAVPLTMAFFDRNQNVRQAQYQIVARTRQAGGR